VQNVLRVPSNAITSVGPVKTVQVVKGGSTTATTVQTGITGGGFTEVISGLQSGQTLQLPTQSTGTTTGTFGGRGALTGLGGAVGGR